MNNKPLVKGWWHTNSGEPLWVEGFSQGQGGLSLDGEVYDIIELTSLRVFDRGKRLVTTTRSRDKLKFALLKKSDDARRLKNNRSVINNICDSGDLKSVIKDESVELGGVLYLVLLQGDSCLNCREHLGDGNMHCGQCGTKGGILNRLDTGEPWLGEPTDWSCDACKQFNKERDGFCTQCGKQK